MQVLPRQSTERVLPQSSIPTAATPLDQVRQTVVLDVEGMKCAGCVRAVESQLAAHEGVISARVNLVTEVAVIEAEEAVSAEVLAEKVTKAGFPTQPRLAGSNSLFNWIARKEEEQKSQLRRFALAIVLLALSTIGHLRHFGWLSVPVLSDLWFHALLATATLAFPAREILLDGWAGMRRLAPNMNTLVTLGSVSAYAASLVALAFPNLCWECFFDEPVMLLSFILLGRTLEQRARYRAADALRSLVELQPATARLIANPYQAKTAQIGVEVPASCLQLGEWVQVLPGEKVPADGVIAVGASTVDESMLTGESLPVLKQPGDLMAAGSLNQSGAIVLKVTNTGGDTLLSQMIALVENAQSRKAPVQRIADVISGYFVYGVLGLAVLTFLFWYWVGLGMWPQVVHGVLGSMHADHALSTQAPKLLVSLKLAIAVLVVACPCALGLATPTAVLVGSSMGAERGLLIRGGDILETIHRLNTVIFDKTGTLTKGQPQVTDVVSDRLEESDLLRLAATVESASQHPLAVAIQQAAQAQGVDLLSAKDFQTEPGLGTTAAVTWGNREHHCVLGNRAWLEQQNVSIAEATEAQVEALAQTGKTVIYVGLDGSLAGLIAVADALREEAQSVVAELQAQGLAVAILTGDKRLVGEAIAANLGLSAKQVMAEVNPKDKAEAIAQLQRQGQVVALVGDGVNDAPALAQADVGIALNSGSDIAIETADVILMGDRLSGVQEAIGLSRATFNKIRQNLGWAFAYNFLGIPLAAGILLPVYGISLSPAAAGGLMAFSSITVVLNSLLLRRYK